MKVFFSASHASTSLVAGDGRLVKRL